jgi:hypothetical protein
MYRVFRYCLLICLSDLAFISHSQQDCETSCAISCCATDPTPAGVMISHLHPKKQFMLSYRYMSMHMGHMQSGTQRISDMQVYNTYVMSSSSMRMDMHMLMGMYGLTNKITLMGMLDYNYNTMGMIMLPTAHMTMPDGEIMGSVNAPSQVSSQGLGDTKLYALYGLVNTSYHHLLLSGGLSIPTGSIKVQGSSSSMYQENSVPYIMQMGTGTWDLMPGITYLHSKDRITWSAQFTSIIHPGFNSLNYAYGNSYSFTSWFAYKWFSLLSSSLRIDANTSGSINGYDINMQKIYNYDPSTISANYGGQHVNTYIGTNFYFPKNTFMKNNRIMIEFGLPIYQNLNGIQQRTKYALNASWSLVF